MTWRIRLYEKALSNLSDTFISSYQKELKERHSGSGFRQFVKFFPATLSVRAEPRSYN